MDISIIMCMDADWDCTRSFFARWFKPRWIIFHIDGVLKLNLQTLHDWSTLLLNWRNWIISSVDKMKTIQKQKNEEKETAKRIEYYNRMERTKPCTKNPWISWISQEDELEWPNISVLISCEKRNTRIDGWKKMAHFTTLRHMYENNTKTNRLFFRGVPICCQTFSCRAISMLASFLNLETKRSVETLSNAKKKRTNTKIKTQCTDKNDIDSAIEHWCCLCEH